MSTEHDITKKTTAASLSAVCELQPENKDRAGRAIPEDYPDQIHHHNERPRKERPEEHPEPQTDPAPDPEQEPGKKQGRKKHEPAQLTEYDPAGQIPFTDGDGEEGAQPHN